MNNAPCRAWDAVTEAYVAMNPHIFGGPLREALQRSQAQPTPGSIVELYDLDSLMVVRIDTPPKNEDK